MFNLIILIIFVLSLIGISIIVYRKIPELKNMPEEKELSSFFKEAKLFWQRIKNSSFIEKTFFEINIFLQKTLSKVKILTLKIEYNISQLLQKLREHARKKKMPR